MQLLNNDATAGNVYAGVLFDFSSGSPLVFNSNTGAFETYNASNIAYYGNRANEGPPTTYTLPLPSNLPPCHNDFPYLCKWYAVAGVNAVEAIPFTDATGVGTFTLTYGGITTAAITYSSTAATLVGNINTALNAAFGTSALVASGSTLAGVIVTFSGGNYKKLPLTGHITSAITITSGSFTINGSTTAGVSTTTTAGVGLAASDLNTPAVNVEKFVWNGVNVVSLPVNGVAHDTTRHIWYVRSGGNDANNGTAVNTPFATFAHAASVSNAGDIIDVDQASAASINTTGLTATVRVSGLYS